MINFVSHDSNHNLEKGPFVYKFVLANLLSKFTQLFNAVVCHVCMAFFKEISSMFNFDDQAAYDLCISLDRRFLAVIVTPNPCPRHVCFMSVT